jgi:hypothetical protein
MKTWALALFYLTVAAVLARAQAAEEGYETATVVSIEKLSANAQHPQNGDHYKVSMRLADTLYLCEGSGATSVFMDWTRGKEFPAKLNDKSLLVKNPGARQSN